MAELTENARKRIPAEALTARSPVIAAVRSEESFEAALASPAETVFLLSSTISRLGHCAQRAKESGKYLFVHADLAEGLGKDREGINYLASLGVSGMISTRAQLIRDAKDAGLCTVQRFFIVDSHSVETAAESIKLSRPDMIEVMPGIAPRIISKMRSITRVPIIAGGLIESKEEIISALNVGADAVSTSIPLLWEI